MENSGEPHTQEMCKFHCNSNKKEQTDPTALNWVAYLQQHHPMLQSSSSMMRRTIAVAVTAKPSSVTKMT